MEPLKEMFNKVYFQKLVDAVSSVFPALNKKTFYHQLTDGLEEKALNERLRHTSMVLQAHLPERFEEAIKVLDQVIPLMDKGYTSLVFPDFVGCFGREKEGISLEALKRYTSYGSSEFAIREFLKKDFDKTFSVMITWLQDPNPHVRRLVSEGTRPRLPWSFKLDAVIQNPGLTSPVLNALCADKELYVKKSVANHLNDISKEHPDYMLKLVKTWDLKNADTAWIVKHASRTLIKKGNVRALKLFKVNDRIEISLVKFKLFPKTITLGQTLHFEFCIRSGSEKTQKLIIDYIIEYRTKTGALSPKVFKLKELILSPGQEVVISKNQKLVNFTTRKHYPGKHKLSIQVNGKIWTTGEFSLSVPDTD
jgi:3-methyladenine DNA glycosylase AlkC